MKRRYSKEVIHPTRCDHEALVGESAAWAAVQPTLEVHVAFVDVKTNLQGRVNVIPSLSP